MNISYNWLKEFINLSLNPEETAEKLTLIGLEVDEVLEYGNLLHGVVVGNVLEVNDHPNADRLVLCQVDIGTDEVQIACGAPNVSQGQNVPVATTGTTLPITLENGDPFIIKKTKLRGKVSEGMICSESELELGDDHSGIMVLDDELKPGTPLHEALALSTDTVFDIELTPNRADAASHLGVARDLAAALGLELNKPFKINFGKENLEDSIDISIKNTEKCHRYVGKLMREVKIQDSPQWLKDRLQALDIRPVNNIVDVTNYVMYEMGQPLHAFDLDEVVDNTITVQDFDEETSFETLDHMNRKCPAGTLFICDGAGPVAIAGVMGGVDSEVTDSTTDILIESAWFAPGTIRKTAKQQGLQTDASYRYERGVDPTIQRIAAERAAELITEISDGTYDKKCTDVHPIEFKPNKITLRKSYTNRILGIEFTLDEIHKTLDNLELSTIGKDEVSITYATPPFRFDLEREIDLIEEIGRLYDYNNIARPKKIDFIEPKPLSEWEKFQTKIKDTVKSLRYKEIFSNSLIPENDAVHFGSVDEMIHTLNPISADMTTLRTTLQPGFLQSAAFNFNRKAKEVRFFEIGHVFEKTTNGTYYSGIGEEVHLLMGLAGQKNQEFWNSEVEPYSIFDLKAGVESLLQALSIWDETKIEVENINTLLYRIEEKKVGTVFQADEVLLNHFDIDQPVYVAEFSLTALFDLISNSAEGVYTPVPKYPTFEFDFAVVVDSNLRAQKLLNTIKNAAEMLNNIQVFDIFEGESIGEHKKSIAFRLSFLDKNKTLTINDIEPIIDKVLKALNKKYSATLRDY